MQRTILVFGLITGSIASVMLVIMMLIHKQNPDSYEWGEPVGYASMLLWVSLIPVAVKNYRDRHQSGIISFKDAFLMGLGIATIASVLYVTTWVIFYKTVYPDFIQDFTKCTIDRLRADGKSAAEIMQARQEIQSMFSYYDTWAGLIGITFVEVFPLGLLVAFVSALVLKRKRDGTVPSQTLGQTA